MGRKWATATKFVFAPASEQEHLKTTETLLGWNIGDIYKHIYFSFAPDNGREKFTKQYVSNEQRNETVDQKGQTIVSRWATAAATTAE